MEFNDIPTCPSEDDTVIQFFKVGKPPGFLGRVTINVIFVEDYLDNTFNRL